MAEPENACVRCRVYVYISLRKKDISNEVHVHKIPGRSILRMWVYCTHTTSPFAVTKVDTIIFYNSCHKFTSICFNKCEKEVFGLECMCVNGKQKDTGKGAVNHQCHCQNICLQRSYEILS